MPAVSPRGARLAFTRYGSAGAQIWITYLDGSGLRQLSSGPSDTMPAWSAAGDQVLFARGARGRRDLYSQLADGSGLRRLTTNRLDDHSPDWARSGRIAFVRADHISTLTPGGSVRRLTSTALPRRLPGLVPDRQDARLRARQERLARPLHAQRRRPPQAAPDRHPRRRDRAGLLSRRLAHRLHPHPQGPQARLLHEGQGPAHHNAAGQSQPARAAPHVVELRLRVAELADHRPAAAGGGRRRHRLRSRRRALRRRRGRTRLLPPEAHLRPAAARGLHRGAAHRRHPVRARRVRELPVRL